MVDFLSYFPSIEFDLKYPVGTGLSLSDSLHHIDKSKCQKSIPHAGIDHLVPIRQLQSLRCGESYRKKS